MSGPERVRAEKRKSLAAHAWGAIAVLTYPCHLPIFAVVLTGTTAGDALGEYRGIAVAALIGLFILAVAKVTRLLTV